MLMVAGKSIIERQISLLHKVGITDIVIVKGYAQEKINYQQIKYYINPDFESTNMLASLFCAEAELNGELIILYSDILFTEEVVKRLINAPGEIVVTVDLDWKIYWKMRYGQIDFDTESLKINSDGGIISLGKISPAVNEIDGRYVGLLKFRPQGIKQIKTIWHKQKNEFWNKPWQVSGRSLSKAFMTDMLQELIEQKHEVRTLGVRNGWLEFDRDEDYERALSWHRDGSLMSILKVDLDA